MSTECCCHDEQCFVCGTNNQYGFQLKFIKDIPSTATTRFLPKKYFQSYENTLHGGIQSLLIDSCMVQALRSVNVVAKTAKLELRYRYQVNLDEELVVSATMTKRLRDFYVVEAEIRQAGITKTTAIGVFKNI